MNTPMVPIETTHIAHLGNYDITVPGDLYPMRVVRITWGIGVTDPDAYTVIATDDDGMEWPLMPAEWPDTVHAIVADLAHRTDLMDNGDPA